MRMIKLFVVLAAVAVMMITPAAAQFFGPALATPAGGYAPGFSESTTWSQGAGAATNAVIPITSATKNPDGSDVPAWLAKRPLSSLATKGRIGLQGKHAGAPIYFRNMKIKTLD